MCTGDSFRNIVFSALETYNKTRSPEAVARITWVDDEKMLVKVEFEGAFCLSCGVRDWVEDYMYILRSMGHYAELVEYIEPGDNEFKRVGVFKVEPCRGGG
ncbi:hypothetical protein [Desulfurococcus mucosus]|uniref:Uncharacterized protein n=1 Tax=Desulfurococcus mucosus (strain ATCC 35584 / DSM 2162 / JCM 9187 / O7/1) TaxID=765177 RepID=E8R9F7_DESM0|nr:hypothetical protein [Desulfurococcus mucosus]ADV65133.1 hypothetical protein Desmu_0829 [Desulfurococcus mucosus DSM 2162]